MRMMSGIGCVVGFRPSEILFLLVVGAIIAASIYWL